MATYSKIYRKIWLDAKFRALSDDGKMLFLFLLTCPDSGTMPGLLRMGKAGLAESLDWSQDRLAKALPEVFPKALPKAFAKGFPEAFRGALAVADWEARLVYLPNALRYNLPQSPNVVRSWSDQWDALPECELKDVAYEAYFEAMKALGEAFAKAFREALAKPFGKPSPKPLANQEQEQEQEQEQDLLPSSDEPGGQPAGGPKSTRRAKPFDEMSPRAQVIETYCLEYERVRGVRPPFAGREAKSADKLIETLKGDHARAMTTIRNAFADPYWREKVTINTIATEPAKFDGARQAKLSLVQDDNQWQPPKALTLEELDQRIGDHDGF